MTEDTYNYWAEFQAERAAETQKWSDAWALMRESPARDVILPDGSISTMLDTLLEVTNGTELLKPTLDALLDPQANSLTGRMVLSLCFGDLLKAAKQKFLNDRI